MHLVQHLFRIRETGSLKFMAAPLVVLPVLPVLDDIVHRNVAPAHLGEGFHQFRLGGVTLPALPEAQYPLGHHGGFAGEGTVTVDYFVVVITGNEIIVGLRLELAPESEAGFLLRALQGRHAKADIGDIPVGFPLNFQGGWNALFQMDGEFVAVRVPGRTPAAAHHLLTAHFRTLETCIILDKMIIPAFLCSDGSLIAHTGKTAFRKVLYSPFVLIVEAVFPLDEFLSAHRPVSTGKFQVKDLSQLAVRLGTSPPA